MLPSLIIGAPRMAMGAGPSVPVYTLDNALCWVSGASVDGDGAPTCYAPEGSGLVGLDYLANAYSDSPAGRHWFGVVCDATGQPIVQGEGQPAPGYYVSATALVNAAFPVGDARRYVDSETVPFISVPPQLLKMGVRMGDVSLVTNRQNGRSVAAVVADVGPHSAIGELSVAAAVALGIPSSPRNGGASHGICYLVFPGSTRGWPREQADVAQQAGVLLDGWGGVVRLSRTVL